MRVVRTSVFETNSSSTHAICIAKTSLPVLPKSVYFGWGEFGWAYRFITGQQKADYLHTAIYACHLESICIEQIKRILCEHGIACTFAEPHSDGSPYPRGYIDHPSELANFVLDVCRDEDKLLQFLFSGKSFIITGNDNDDNIVSIDVYYPHTEYYKGN